MLKRSAPPSAHDVARLAGVSQAAVSRAFTPGASISTATREKVVVAAETLGYRPNLLARSLIKGRSGIVGVVVGNPRYPFFLAALHALSARLSQAGKHMLVYTADGSSTVDAHVEGLLKYRVDALLLMAVSITPELAARCEREGVPLISFIRAAQPLPGFVSITGNNVGGAATVAAHLLQQGYRRIALMAGLPSSSSQERERGFVEFLSEQGVTLADRAVGNFRREEAVKAARALLSRPVRPDAIFCANDDMALAVVEMARFEFGLSIGRDLGVAGFDDIEQASWPSFDLTTYSLPVELMMQRAVEALSADPRTAVQPHIVVEGGLQVRGSTRRR